VPDSPVPDSPVPDSPVPDSTVPDNSTQGNAVPLAVLGDLGVPGQTCPADCCRQAASA
jgi:hypothetical protein